MSTVTTTDQELLDQAKEQERLVREAILRNRELTQQNIALQREQQVIVAEIHAASDRRDELFKELVRRATADIDAQRAAGTLDKQAHARAVGVIMTRIREEIGNA